MSEYDDDEGGRGFRRMVRESKEEAYHARRQLRRELPEASMNTKLEVAAALCDYRDVLSDYHDEGALKTPWEDRNVDWIDDALSETVTVEESLNRRGHATRKREVPRAAAVDATDLIDVGNQLDAIAKELGFAASTKDVTAGGKATEDDLMGLLTARGQDDALDRLPDRWEPADGGDAA
jgi:hypothetical protein